MEEQGRDWGGVSDRTMALSPEKSEARKGFFVVCSRSKRSALKVSLFFSRKPSRKQ